MQTYRAIFYMYLILLHPWISVKFHLIRSKAWRRIRWSILNSDIPAVLLLSDCFALHVHAWRILLTFDMVDEYSGRFSPCEKRKKNPFSVFSDPVYWFDCSHEWETSKRPVCSGICHTEISRWMIPGTMIPVWQEVEHAKLWLIQSLAFSDSHPLLGFPR